MSAHEGVSCDACGKSNFRSKRYKCLICYDYDLCSTCYEQGEASSHHTNEHPMQCILTRQDFDFYYHGERYTSDQAQSFTCPFCGEMGFSLPFINESSSSSSSQNFDLFHHLQLKHADEQQSNEVICPICAAMINGEPNLVTADLLSHIANEHQHQQVQTPSTPGIGINPYSRQSSSSNRESDFTTSTSTRAGFRRGPLRTPGRRGGLGRGGGAVSQHFVVDTSSVNSGSDPIADLLTQLSTVRRLAAVNNNNNNSSSSNTINLQTLTRQQYERERERLRTTGRSHHQQQQSHHSQQTVSSSNNLPSIENDFFDSLFASALFIDSSSSSNNTHQTWAQIVAQQQQSTPEQQQQQQQQQQSSTTKTTTIEPDPSLLRRLCDGTSSSSSLTQQNSSVVQQQKCKNDFVHSLLFASFVCPFNDKDK
ncbi:unnamed protein product [Rotaria sordida]|uniref:RING-type E3 ubiquitin transferase n=1 Tax=Rotaria sordida TaxID=392033 RepID=A0A814VYV7_9BILA|nr:unnamed protein product [Rotaria sordida]CAF1393115.1 unnamed protein product [Rotaria sordida]CAF3712820.1 unnamed protein product [Rotaria sordida]CAF3872217.1 unnamed protein product [Rotaria sordida]